MKSGTWQFKAVLLTVGAVLVAVTAILWPHVAFSYSKQRAMDDVQASSAGQTGQAARMEPEVCHILTADWQGESACVKVDGWAFSLPAGGFRAVAGDGRPRTLVSDQLAITIDSVKSKSPDFKPQFMPSNPQVIKYFQECDPYDMLLDAFRSTPADVERAESPAQLQKALYLLLLRTTLHTHGSEKRLHRIDVRGRRGLLSGDETSKILVASIYLPQCKSFADVAIYPKSGATMKDIYACLGSLDIQPDPTWQPASAGFDILP